MMWSSGFNWGSMLLMMLSMAIWIAFLVVLVWAGIRWFEKKMHDPDSREMRFSTSEPMALEILRQRYAHGDIDTATFEQMQKRLETVSSRERIG